MAKNTIQSLERAMSILEYLSKHPKSRLQDISESISLKKTTVYTLMYTLEKNNYVERDSSIPRYSLGPKLFQLGKLYEQHFDIKKYIKILLTALRDFTNETSYFAIYSGEHYIFIEKVDSHRRIRSQIPLGHEEKIRKETAMGQIFLSYLENKTILDIAYNFEVTEKGMVCIAFPILKDNTFLGVVSIEGSSSHLTKKFIDDIYNEWKNMIKKTK